MKHVNRHSGPRTTVPDEPLSSSFETRVTGGADKVLRFPQAPSSDYYGWPLLVGLAE